MNPRLEKLLKRPLYQRIGVLAAILLGIASLFYFFLYMPAMEELDPANKKDFPQPNWKRWKMAANLKNFRMITNGCRGGLSALTELQ